MPKLTLKHKEKPKHHEAEKPTHAAKVDTEAIKELVKKEPIADEPLPPEPEIPTPPLPEPAPVQSFRYRIKQTKKFSFRGQMITLNSGEIINVLNYGPGAMDIFKDVGLELEPVK